MGIGKEMSGPGDSKRPESPDSLKHLEHSAGQDKLRQETEFGKYKIKSGDTLAEISAKTKVSQSALYWANRDWLVPKVTLKDNNVLTSCPSLPVNKELRIPAPHNDKQMSANFRAWAEKTARQQSVDDKASTKPASAKESKEKKVSEKHEPLAAPGFVWAALKAADQHGRDHRIDNANYEINRLRAGSIERIADHFQNFIDSTNIFAEKSGSKEMDYKYQGEEAGVKALHSAAKALEIEPTEKNAERFKQMYRVVIGSEFNVDEFISQSAKPHSLPYPELSKYYIASQGEKVKTVQAAGAVGLAGLTLLAPEVTIPAQIIYAGLAGGAGAATVGYMNKGSLQEAATAAPDGIGLGLTVPLGAGLAKGIYSGTAKTLLRAPASAIARTEITLASGQTGYTLGLGGKMIASSLGMAGGMGVAGGTYDAGSEAFKQASKGKADLKSLGVKFGHGFEAGAISGAAIGLAGPVAIEAVTSVKGMLKTPMPETKAPASKPVVEEPIAEPEAKPQMDAEDAAKLTATSEAGTASQIKAGETPPKPDVPKGTQQPDLAKVAHETTLPIPDPPPADMSVAKGWWQKKVEGLEHNPLVQRDSIKESIGHDGELVVNYKTKHGSRQITEVYDSKTGTITHSEQYNDFQKGGGNIVDEWVSRKWDGTVDHGVQRVPRPMQEVPTPDTPKPEAPTPDTARLGALSPAPKNPGEWLRDKVKALKASGEANELTSKEANGWERVSYLRQRGIDAPVRVDEFHNPKLGLQISREMYKNAQGIAHQEITEVWTNGQRTVSKYRLLDHKQWKLESLESKPSANPIEGMASELATELPPPPAGNKLALRRWWQSRNEALSADPRVFNMRDVEPGTLRPANFSPESSNPDMLLRGVEYEKYGRTVQELYRPADGTWTIKEVYPGPKGNPIEEVTILYPKGSDTLGHRNFIKSELTKGSGGKEIPQLRETTNHVLQEDKTWKIRDQHKYNPDTGRVEKVELDS